MMATAENFNKLKIENESDLQKENEQLKNAIASMKSKFADLQDNFKASEKVKERMEGLCRELQKQNKFIQAESNIRIQEAETKGKEIANEMHNNLGFVNTINQNLASITSDSEQVKKENMEMAKKILILKDHYEEREKVLIKTIEETEQSATQAQSELIQFNLKSAEEREKLMEEMKQLADALMKSHEQIQEARNTEGNLRNLITNYDQKFSALQTSLKETNVAYEEFRREMNRVSSRTIELEKETEKWQNRWQESHDSLNLMRENHRKLEEELEKAEQSLEQMKELCRQLQQERKGLLEKVKAKESKENKLTANGNENSRNDAE